METSPEPIAPQIIPRLTTKEKFKKKLEEEIRTRQEMLTTLDTLGLEELTIEASLYGSQLDFDNLSHDDVIKVIKAIGGKWDKRVSCGTGDRIDYVTRKNGITIRCYQGEPPPNCRVEEVLETVPATPEHVVTRRKLVCK